MRVVRVDELTAAVIARILLGWHSSATGTDHWRHAIVSAAAPGVKAVAEELCAKERQDIALAVGGRDNGNNGLLDTCAAAEFLGCSKRTVQRMLADGDLASFKDRGRRFIRSDALVEYLDRQSSKECAAWPSP